MKVRVRTDINARKIANQVSNNTRFWTFAASEWKRLITPFVPFDTGNLSENVTIKANSISYNADYAKGLYYGRNIPFRRDKHPKATHHWSDAAKPTQLPKLIRILQRRIERESI